MTLGKNIRRKRIEHGIDQKELAGRLGVTPASVCYFESDKKLPSVSVLIRLADIFGCTTDELLGRNVS